MSSATPFRMECPKCTSTNVDLEEDQRAYLGGGRHQVQLHCYTCGHIIYGEKRIQAECDRQYQAWESTHSGSAPAPAPAAEPAPAPAPAPEAAAPAPAASEAPAPAPSPAPAPAPAADSGRKSRSRRAPAAKAPAPAPSAAPSADEDPGPGRSTGELDPETGLEIVVPTYEAPTDKKGRPIKPCAWPPCPRYARPNSKYCSRNCSNKNARARYARRNDS